MSGLCIRVDWCHTRFGPLSRGPPDFYIRKYVHVQSLLHALLAVVHPPAGDEVRVIPTYTCISIYTYTTTIQNISPYDTTQDGAVVKGGRRRIDGGSEGGYGDEEEEEEVDAAVVDVNAAGFVHVTQVDMVRTYVCIYVYASRDCSPNPSTTNPTTTGKAEIPLFGPMPRCLALPLSRPRQRRVGRGDVMWLGKSGCG